MLASQLEMSKGIAISATKTKTRFLAAASHDLRQPLQSLRLYLAALTSQSDHLEQEKILKRMGQSVDSIGELLDGFLNISKLDNGVLTPDRYNFQLQELLGRIVNNNVQQANYKGVRLECYSEHVYLYTLSC